MPKDQPTPKAPQNRKQPKAPEVPGTVTVAFCGGVEVGVVPHEQLGPLHEGTFAVRGGQIIIRWPLAFTPKIIEGMQASYDDAVAAGALDEARAAEAGLELPAKGIWTPGR